MQNCRREETNGDADVGDAVGDAEVEAANGRDDEEALGDEDWLNGVTIETFEDALLAASSAPSIFLTGEEREISVGRED